MEKAEKKEITAAEFDKKVDIARAHYEYMDRMNPEAARAAAVKEISEKFVVGVAAPDFA